MDSEPDAPGDTPVSFYLVAVLLAFVAVFGYALTFPVILHYRTKYAGRPGGAPLPGSDRQRDRHRRARDLAPPQTPKRLWNQTSTGASSFRVDLPYGLMMVELLSATTYAWKTPKPRS